MRGQWEGGGSEGSNFAGWLEDKVGVAVYGCSGLIERYRSRHRVATAFLV